MAKFFPHRDHVPPSPPDDTQYTNYPHFSVDQLLRVCAYVRTHERVRSLLSSSSTHRKRNWRLVQCDTISVLWGVNLISASPWLTGHYETRLCNSENKDESNCERHSLGTNSKLSFLPPTNTSEMLYFNREVERCEVLWNASRIKICRQTYVSKGKQFRVWDLQCVPCRRSAFRDTFSTEKPPSMTTLRGQKKSDSGKCNYCHNICKQLLHKSVYTVKKQEAFSLSFKVSGIFRDISQF